MQSLFHFLTSCCVSCILIFGRILLLMGTIQYDFLETDHICCILVIFFIFLKRFSVLQNWFEVIHARQTTNVLHSPYNLHLTGLFSSFLHFACYLSFQRLNPCMTFNRVGLHGNPDLLHHIMYIILFKVNIISVNT